MQETLSLFFINNFGHKSIFSDRIIIFLSNSFPYILGGFFFLFLFCSKYQRQQKWEIFKIAFFSIILSRLFITEIIRFFWHRLRPYLVYNLNPLFLENSYSFPSGHATFLFALSTVVFIYNKKIGIWFFALTSLICIARIIAGVHYLSDIIVGAFIGIISAYFVEYLYKSLINKGK